MAGDIWDIDWSLEGWSVELTRGGGLVSVEWDAVRMQSACRVYDGEFRDLTWPWWGIPSDPAEVIDKVRRLANEHLTPVPPATSGNPK